MSMNINERINKIIDLSRQAQDAEWQEINRKIKALSRLNPDKTAQAAITFVDDPNPQVRDAVASVLAALDIKNPTLLRTCTQIMSMMAQVDPNIFAAGRAATYLLRHQNNQDVYPLVEAALPVFRTRAIERGWVKELKANIPDENLHQLFDKTCK